VHRLVLVGSNRRGGDKGVLPLDSRNTIVNVRLLADIGRDVSEVMPCVPPGASDITHLHTDIFSHFKM
jgi:hypothetical protein